MQNNFTLSGTPTQNGITAYNATAVAYQWYDCPSSVTVSTSTTVAPSCTTISGATGSSYTPTSTDASNGYKLLVAETVTNSAGSVTVYSTTTSSVSGASSTLTVTETAGNNASFSASATLAGGSSGTTPTYAYEWYTCTGPLSPTPTTTPVALGTGTSSFTAPTTSSGTCTAQAGGTSYTVASSTLLTDGLVLEAIATVPGVGWWMNYSAATTLSSVTTVVTGVTVATTSTGSQASSAPDGSTLYATALITAMPAATPTYDWYLCTSSFVGGASAPTGCGSSLSTAPSYAPALTTTQLNSGTTYYVVVEATASSSSYYSASVTLTTAPPAMLTYPSVPSSASTTTALTATASTWSGAPTPTLTNQWYYCTGAVAAPATTLATNCYAISGATALSFQPTASMANDYFLIATTANNGITSGGVSTAKTVYSASTTVPLVATLSITGLVISGVPAVGGTLTSSATVSPSTSYTASFQWYECTSAIAQGISVPANCYVIVGATGASFAPTVNQISYYLTVAETVTGSGTTATMVAASTALVTSSIPGAPTAAVAVAGLGQATVSWTAPTTGYTVASYKVLASNGATCTATTTSCVVTGLLYGTTYTFTVTATNTYGTGPASAVSNAIMPSESYPAAPTAVRAVAGTESAVVSWTAAVNNGSLITLYVVTSNPGGLTCTTTSTSCVVSGLTNSTAYTFSVTARNAVGTGPASLASAAVTPKVAPPPVPMNIVVKRLNGAITVTWSAGIANGTVSTGYVVTATGGGSTRTCTTTANTCTVTGLTNGVGYQVTIIAKSATASSTPTVIPRLVTPAGHPSPPVIFHSARGAGVVIVYFRAPVSLNGAPVAYYQYLINGRWTVQPAKGKLVIVLRGLLRHHAYIVRVRAVSVGGPSAASLPVRVITL